MWCSQGEIPLTYSAALVSGAMLLVGRALEEQGEVVAGELPPEGISRLLVAALEGQQALLDRGQAGGVVGVRHLRCTIDRLISTWFNLEACTGVRTNCAVGHALAMRSMAAWPRWELSLSTTQNTRR